MPADDQEVHTAADIVTAIDNLLDFHRAGLIDATDSIVRAFEAFEEAACESHADAMAFISMSRRLIQSITADLLAGLVPDQYSVDASDRYMETALAFLHLAAGRDHMRHLRQSTIH